MTYFIVEDIADTLASIFCLAKEKKKEEQFVLVKCGYNPNVEKEKAKEKERHNLIQHIKDINRNKKIDIPAILVMLTEDELLNSIDGGWDEDNKKQISEVMIKGKAEDSEQFCVFKPGDKFLLDIMLFDSVDDKRDKMLNEFVSVKFADKLVNEKSINRTNVKFYTRSSARTNPLDFIEQTNFAWSVPAIRPRNLSLDNDSNDITEFIEYILGERMSKGPEKSLIARGLVKQENNLYHYTNVEALKKIIDSSTLLATHMQYLNDWSEYERGYNVLVETLKNIIYDSKKHLGSEEYKILKKNVNKLPLNCPKTPSQYEAFLGKQCQYRESKEKLLPEVYSVSFCKQSNLLNQWINYARESGICIEFDFSGYDFICPDVTDADKELYVKKMLDKAIVYDGYRPMQVVYDDRVMQDIIENDISSYLQRNFDKMSKDIKAQWWIEMGDVFSIVPYFKHNAFSPEEEVRLAVRPIKEAVNYVYPQGIKQSAIFAAKIYHMEKNHILRPYIKIQWRKKTNAGENM